ncbi:hypothetical protein [Parasitella parasitica]|uniref:Ricin B lectin domain-containing protein n=1 Tax=Parasitella parasitica TaxID=35722 RepID=A0A0B7N8P1_9FUNG|nr:hypothetical protein [Parasitella parasitica]
MTIETNNFPKGYFYIISNMNGMALDIDMSEGVATAGTKLVTAPKKEEKLDRDTQLWIHQNGFLTNKAAGLVMDVGKSKNIVDLLKRHEHLYVDTMKTEDNADQRFGCSANGHIYTLCDHNEVVDIRGKDAEAGATIMIYKKAEDLENAMNQLWSFPLADPPQAVDSSDDDDDGSSFARLSAWFGSWTGWGSKKDNVLQEKELEKAHKKVYEKNKTNLSYEIIAGAVAVQAVKMYMDKKEEEGEDVHFKSAKQAVAAYAAKEMVKKFMERDDTDKDEKTEKKNQTLYQRMAEKAAVNYFESKYKE